MTILVDADSCSFDVVVAKLEALIEQCRGADWVDSVEELRKHLIWEYEGMSP